MSVIPDALDYQIKDRVSGRYYKNRVAPIDGTSLTLSATGTSTRSFKLPANVHNQSLGVLAFDMLVPANTSTYNYLNLHLNQIPIQTIRLRDDSNQMLASIENAHKYFNTIMNEFKQDYIDSLDSFSSTAGTGSGICLGIRPNRAVVAVANYRINNDGTAMEASVVPYDERLYFRQQGNTTANSFYTYWRIPMNILTHTIFSVNQDMYYDKNLTLEIEFCKYDNYILQNHTANDVVTGVITKDGNPVSLANLYYYQAVQQNQAIVQEITGLFNSGRMKLLVPFVTTYRRTLENAGTHDLNIIISNVLGQKLKDIYITPYNTTETLTTSFLHSNVAGYRITDFLPFLDSQPLYSSRIVSASNDDYMIMKEKFLNGSCTMVSNVYQANWYWHESFCDRTIGEHNISDGLDISKREIIFRMDINAPRTNAYYVFVVTEKVASLSPAGIIISPAGMFIQ